MLKGLTLAFTLVLVAGCSGSGSPSSSSGAGGSAPASLLDPPPTGQGIQYKMVSSLDAGQEIERVQFFQVPPEGLYVNREEVRFTTGSHHVLIYKTPYTSIPTVDVHGNQVDTSGVIDAPNGGTADWNIDGVVAGAQSADAPPIVDQLPPNVAVKLPGNTVILMNTHYLNATASPVTVEARVNLWSVPAAQVTVEAGIMFYYDPIIRVPAHAASYAEMSCPVMADITLLTAQTHMHRRGLGGEAFVIPPGSTTPDMMYSSDSWENVPVESFTPGKLIKAGSWIDYHCNYMNTQSNTILQGLSTKDEMCMFIGVYYPKDPKTELCSTDGTYNNLSSAGVYEGKGGTVGCIDSVSCLLNAQNDDATYQCILSACPAVAKPFNDAFKCMANFVSSCQTSCKTSKDQGTCIQTCLEHNCPKEALSCSAASCK